MIDYKNLHMLERHIQDRLLDFWQVAPVTLLQGARQTGKTTLAKLLAESRLKAQYLTFDDAQVLSAAITNPQEFITSLKLPVVIDEVQLAPEIFRPIKLVVDRHRKPGQFLLTGSANIMLLPRLSESLAGRMYIATLWPLSRGEISGSKDTWIDAMFRPDVMPTPAAGQAISRDELLKSVITGGYPAAQSSNISTREWFGSYISTILHRDVRELANVERLAQMPNLLALLSSRLGGLLNISDLSSVSGIPHTTLTRYLAVLEGTFLLQMLPAWSPQRAKRISKSRKVFFNDTGLAAHLNRISLERAIQEPYHIGALLENFVLMELKKQSTWSLTLPELYHFRTRDGVEVDIILEDGAGKIIGVEVKTSTTVSAGDFKGLHYLKSNFPKIFHRGFVFYTGDKTLPFGPDLWCMPIDSLWRLKKFYRPAQRKKI